MTEPATPVADPALIEQAAALLRQADALVIAAGAGISVDSGLPDFRGPQGFWRAYPALRQAGLDFYRIASPATFREQPALAWGFYGHRLKLYRRTQPHRGFALLRQWGEHLPLGCSVFTSNVDGQFQKAGFGAEQVYECHGAIGYLQCLDGCQGDIWPADDFDPQVDETRCLLLNAAPRCPHCGTLARPNILMFGDDGWLEERSARQARQLESWLSRSNHPVVIELGAGSRIPTVRHFSEQVVRQLGGRLVRINPYECEVPSSQDVGLALGASVALQAIADVLGPAWQLPARHDGD